MKDSGWSNNHFKLCTCRDNRPNFQPQGDLCPHCGTKLTFQHCTACNGTGNGKCFKCQGMIPWGCVMCSGTGFVAIHDCQAFPNKGIRPPEVVVATINNPRFKEPLEPGVDLGGLGIPQMTKCLICNGTGKSSWPSIGTPIDCSACKGKGWVPSTMPSSMANGIGEKSDDSGWLWVVGGLILLGLVFA